MKKIFSSITVGLIFIVMFSILVLAASQAAIINQSTDSISQQAESGWWPMFHNNLSHEGFSPADGPATNQTLWSYTTAGRIWSSPAVTDGLLFVGSFDKNMYALDATKGTLTWNFSTGGQIYTSPAVSDGIVYFGSNDYQVYALKANNGNLVWNFTTGKEVQSTPPSLTA